MAPRTRRAVLGFAAAAAVAAGGAAGADWIAVAADDGIHSAYADPASIRRRGAIVSMHGLYNFVRRDLTPDGEPFRSTTVLRAYDCAGRRVRLLSYADHSEPFGGGRVVSASHAPRPWQEVVEGSGDAAFLRVACAAN